MEMRAEETKFQFKYIPEVDMNKILERVQNDRKNKISSAGLSGCGCGQSDVKFSRLSKFEVLSTEDLKGLLKSNLEEKSEDEPTKPMPVSPKISPETSEISSRKSAISVHFEDEIQENEYGSDTEIEDENGSDTEIEDFLGQLDREENVTSNSALEVPKRVHLSNLKQQQNKVIEYGDLEAYQGNIGDSDEVKLTEQEEHKLFEILKKAEFKSKETQLPYEESSRNSQEQIEEILDIYPNVEVRMKNANYQAESDEEFNVWEEFENEPPVPVKGNHGGRNEKSRKMSSVQKSSLQKPTEASLRRQKEVKKESPVKKVCKEKRDPDAEIQEIFEKITSFQKKTCESLDGLRETIMVEPELEDEEDYRRRQQRSTEFTNRFARNYLYQIGRVSEELRYLHMGDMEIPNKVYSIYQTIMLAAQAYDKYVELFIFNKCPDKLQVFVDFIINATKICLDKKIFDKRDLLIQKLMKKCVFLKNQLVDNLEAMPKKFKPNYKKRETKRTPPSQMFVSPYGSQTKNSSKKTPMSTSSFIKRMHMNNSPYPQRTHPFLPKPGSSSANSKVSSKSPPRSTYGMSSRNEAINFKNLAETVQNLAEEKITEMLIPLMNNFSKKSSTNPSTEGSVFSETSGSRVTADKNVKRIPVKDGNEGAGDVKEAKGQAKIQAESVQTIAKNVQYTTIKAADPEPTVLKDETDNNEETDSRAATPTPNTIAEKPRKDSKTNFENVDLRKMHFDALKEFAKLERSNFIASLTENPKYVNDVVSKPWEMLSRMSDEMVMKLVDEVCAEIDLGEVSVLQEMLQQEITG